MIEDTFNTQNNGIWLDHVFCANPPSKNYYTRLQVAQVLWTLTYRGALHRLYDWARRATEQGLARAVWEGMRSARSAGYPCICLRWVKSDSVPPEQEAPDASRPDPIGDFNPYSRLTLRGLLLRPLHPTDFPKFHQSLGPLGYPGGIRKRRP